MKKMLEKVFDKFINEKKSFKIIAWIFILLVIITILLYPIIDANFLYYDRTNKRIDIIQKISNISEETLNKDERIRKEYNRILDDMENQSNNYLNNIFVTETNHTRNIVKFISGSWIFLILGGIMPFTKDNKTGKRFSLNNVMASILCFFIACALGFIAVKIPNIINYMVNIILYQIILIFFAYTISTSNKKVK